MRYIRDMRLREKMLFFVLSMTLLIYLFSLGYITSIMRNKSFNDAEQLAQTQAREYANEVKTELNYDFDLSRGLGWALQNFPDIPEEIFDDYTSDLLFEFLDRNPNFFSVWVSFELNSLLPDWNLPYGRVRKTWLRENGRMIFQQDTLNTDGDDPGSLYAVIKQNMEEVITDPYWYSYTGDEADQVMEVSPAIPIVINDQFAGLAGSDIILERFQDLIMELEPFGVGYAYLLANDGTYVAHPNEDLLGEKIHEVRETYTFEFDMQEAIMVGNFTSHYSHNDDLGEEAFMAYAPIFIGDTDAPWSFAIAVPRSYIVAEANHIFYRSLIVAIVGLLILTYIIFVIAGNIAKPLSVTTKTIERIALGDIEKTKPLQIKGNDEVGEMSSALNKLLKGLKDTASFAQNIGRGELDVDFEKLSNKDVLGSALLDMRDSLKKARDEQKERQIEEDKRNWVTQGQAKFADILRQDNDDMEVLSFNVIKNLVKYVEANQGGLFILNDEDKNDPYLELVACYAYDRKKYVTRKIQPGEGLVGACYLEKKPVFLTQVPQDYIYITSGLGDENPDCILLVPVLLNEEVYGVIELAAFKEFEKHVVSFIEKVAENIASTISTVKINIRTAQLLEQSQQQAEEMRAQEEEMRQNMEEMHATQEEMQRKDSELLQHVETSESIFCVMEYDKDGIIQKVNNNYEQASGYSKEELKGQHHSVLFDNQDWKNAENYKMYWNNIKQGIPVKGTWKRTRKDGEYFVLKGASKAVLDEQSNIVKIIEISIDITDVAFKK